ncbi:MAG: hypothetical protein V2I74_12460 [Erythrobacter sp.]|jgi:hypothetical protein|nr:hypothetical protein [Erythrobacter sp.]
MLALLTTGAATASLMFPTGLPRYREGDAFVFSDGRVEQVVAVNATTTTWRGLGRSSYRRSRNFVVPVLEWRSGRGSGRREVRGTPDALWPLDRPRSARFRVITETRANPQAGLKRSVSMWVCKSGRIKPFTVEAGTFAAVPVKCDRYSPTTMRLLERREWDYAPELGHYIRRVTVNYLRGTTRSVELVAALSGPAATRPRLRALSQKARTQQLARSGR